MSNILLIAVGGSLGALTRYGATLLAARLFGAGFPWGTLFVNLAGCFLIGVAFALAERGAWMGPSARLFFVTGFLGALTTFSTFAMETVGAGREGSGLMVVANLLAHNVGGLLMVIAGMAVVRWTA